MHIPVHIQSSKPGHGVRVFCPDIPGCSATGASVDQALSVLRRRIDAHFARSASEVPPPGVTTTVIVL
jgi:predicted RNase H-like HicB family nuclease